MKDAKELELIEARDEAYRECDEAYREKSVEASRKRDEARCKWDEADRELRKYQEQKRRKVGE